MKRMILSLLVILSAASTFAMTKSRAREEAWFLTDKMAYELFLTAEQMEDVYEINYDYFRALSSYRYTYTKEYRRRLDDLAYVLTARQWRRFETIADFVNPAKVVNKKWTCVIYNRYNSNLHYYAKPKSYTLYVGTSRRAADYYLGRQKMHADHVKNRVGTLNANRRYVTPTVGNHNGSAANHQNQVNKGHAALAGQTTRKDNGHQTVKDNGKTQNKTDRKSSTTTRKFDRNDNSRGRIK